VTAARPGRSLPRRLQGEAALSHQVFISCSSHDRTVGNATCAILERHGYRCWIAPRDIMPGREWAEAIVEGIAGAKIFVLIFSTNANDSPQVRREVERAVHHGLVVVPLRIENVPPSRSLEYFMSAPHWLDAMTPPLERHLDHLAEVVGRLLGETEAATPAPPPATQAREPAWLSILSLALLVATPAVAALLRLDPPWPNRIGYVSAALVAAGAGAVHYRPSLPNRPARTWAGRIAAAAVVAGLIAYFVLSSLYVETIPRSGVRVVKGFACTKDALLVYGAACPDLGRDALRDAEWEPTNLWTASSVTMVRIALLASWLLLVGGLAAAAAGIERRRMRSG
jgi:hypothetical protein